jgi:hypothetical protein
MTSLLSRYSENRENHKLIKAQKIKIDKNLLRYDADFHAVGSIPR